MRTRLALLPLVLCVAPVLADGPQDNVAANVRRIPKPGIEVSEADRTELEAGLAKLDAVIASAREKGAERLPLLPDVEVFHRAVRTALDHGEFFEPGDVKKAKALLAEGVRRAERLAAGDPGWHSATGLVVRGYRSKIDRTVQPYGLVVPPNYKPDGEKRHRLDVWFHGRGETLSEVNFLDDRMRNVGQFAPADTIVLHPYGRYCNANKFAGEVDVLEAIDDVKRRYRIDDDRISVRGFSMGGASAWQFAVHYSDRWFAANPGAGFAETPRFLNVFQNEKVEPAWYERKLWNLYDCDKWVVNLAQCPTVAYSGEIDKQKQAADVMAEALAKHGIPLTHVIGPETAHKYHPDSAKIVDEKLASLAEVGRRRFPMHVQFETYTLKYDRMNWVTIDAMEEHWARAAVRTERFYPNQIDVLTSNVAALTLDFPPGRAPFEAGMPVRVVLDQQHQTVLGPAMSSDRSWSLSLHKEGNTWTTGPPPAGLRKKHGLQGPIDDAFMDSFVFVRPTGESKSPKFAAWSKAELHRAVEHWRRHFRGDARVKDDAAITDDDIATANLVLWGDPESNAVLKRIADKLPIRWDAGSITAGDRTFPSADHALAMIHPNPLNPDRYVVLNSGFTFRDYAYLNNARQVPMLPDWAVIDLRTPPDAVRPGRIAAADFFGERWELRPPHDEGR